MKDTVKYVIQRILLIFLTAFIVLSVTYILLQCLPIKIAGTNAQGELQFWENQVSKGFYVRVTNAEEILRGAFDEHVIMGEHDFYYRALPVMTRYFSWLMNIVTRWDWGVSTSIQMNTSAMNIILEHLPYSMKINVIAILFSIPLGIGLGVWAALKKNTLTDSIISTVIMIFISVPSFVLISFILLWFAYGLKWLPSGWPTAANAEADPVNAVKAYIIPVSCLCFGSIASFARYTRAELCEIMSSEFLLLARTKGLTKPQTILRHALRNSMVPIIPMIIGQFIGILSGSMVLEQLYSIPGIGRLFVDALTAKDYPVVMVDMAVYSLIGLFATLLVDLSYGVVDPRIRMGAKK